MTHDPSKSLGERLADAIRAVGLRHGDDPPPWCDLEAQEQGQLDEVAGWRPIGAVTPKHMQEALLWFPDFVGQERQIGLWFEYDSPYHVKGQWVGRDDGEPFETICDLVFPTHIASLPAPPPKDPTHDQ